MKSRCYQRDFRRIEVSGRLQTRRPSEPSGPDGDPDPTTSQEHRTARTESTGASAGTAASGLDTARSARKGGSYVGIGAAEPEARRTCARCRNGTGRIEAALPIHPAERSRPPVPAATRDRLPLTRQNLRGLRRRHQTFRLQTPLAVETGTKHRIILPTTEVSDRFNERPKLPSIPGPTDVRTGDLVNFRGTISSPGEPLTTTAKHELQAMNSSNNASKSRSARGRSSRFPIPNSANRRRIRQR